MTTTQTWKRNWSGAWLKGNMAVFETVLGTWSYTMDREKVHLELRSEMSGTFGWRSRARTVVRRVRAVRS